MVWVSVHILLVWAPQDMLNKGCFRRTTGPGRGPLSSSYRWGPSLNRASANWYLFMQHYFQGFRFSYCQKMSTLFHSSPPAESALSTFLSPQLSLGASSTPACSTWQPDMVWWRWHCSSCSSREGGRHWGGPMFRDRLQPVWQRQMDTSRCGSSSHSEYLVAGFNETRVGNYVPVVLKRFGLTSSVQDINRTLCMPTLVTSSHSRCSGGSRGFVSMTCRGSCVSRHSSLHRLITST